MPAMCPRPSDSSRHRSHSPRATGGFVEDMVDRIKESIMPLYLVGSSYPHHWEVYLASARSAVSALEHIDFFRDPSRIAEQTWMVQGLQEYAFCDADNGCIVDIADFCQTSWLTVLRNKPENVEALTGLGNNWLQRAQCTLAKIHYEEGDDSASGQSGHSGQAVSAPNDFRRQGPLYVEARGYLHPAVDFFTRAVRSADALGTTDGQLLALAAESEMSLGNVTAPPRDERHFAQAVRYLRRAEAIPGNTLSTYLRQYLNDYGRYVP